jgi:hypothetical protein
MPGNAISPAMRAALDLLRQNSRGVVQVGTANVVVYPRDPRTNRRIWEGGRSVTDRTLSALRRLGLVTCVPLSPSKRLNARGRRNPKNRRRRWMVRDVE